MPQTFTFQRHLPTHLRASATGLFFDSHAWMATALQKDKESARRLKDVTTNMQILNVALVSVAIAIELT